VRGYTYPVSSHSWHGPKFGSTYICLLASELIKERSIGPSQTSPGNIAERESDAGDRPVSKRLKKTAVVVVVILAAAQFIRPEHANPAIDQNRTIGAQMGAESSLVTILDRSCGDCHSDATTWPWYTQIAPLSWLMAYGVTTGRDAINFSDWAAYPPGAQKALLAASCRDVSTGKMPGTPYTLFHPEARLTASDIDTICAAIH